MRSIFSFSKYGVLLLLFSTGELITTAQVSNTLPWTWINGDNTTNPSSVFGTMGTPAAGNKPGSREGCGQNWTDSAGNLWLFGGYGYISGSTGWLNDLWKYDTKTNLWCWINGDNSLNNYGNYGSLGVAAASNKPGGRHLATTWADNSGNLWLFGGVGQASSSIGDLNDLWKYNIATNQWTWINGDNTPNNAGVYGTIGTAASTNKPGARSRACRPDARSDAGGNLWLFGGNGYAAASSGDLNDLWKYSIASNQWTWMGGDNTAYSTGVYGTMGTPAAANKPGARVGGLCWIDSAGKFWLNGGSGTNGGASWTPKYSDLWKFDPATSLWTWVKGDNTTNNFGNYGTLGVVSATNNPGGRLMATNWIDNYGNFWIFGGYGFSAPGTGDLVNGNQGLSDLWKYDPLTNNWTWMKGDSLPAQSPVYGTLGTSAPANKPGNRSGGDQWKDGQGNLWQMGGLDWGSPTVYRNDLWKLVIPQPVAKGNHVSCQVLPTVTIDNTNNSTWVAIYDSIGNIAAEINANGNNLGTVSTSLYAKTGACREDASHRLYLNRNITITPQNQPASGTVSLRLYVLKAELDSLKDAQNSQGQPSGVASVNEVDVFKNGDACSTVGSINALPLSATTGTYNSDYYLQVSISSFSSFYFANKLLTAILPAKLVSFTGTRSNAGNLLQWRADCNGPISFYIERSTDGTDFERAGMLNTTGCAQSFSYLDPLTAAIRYYYRLRIIENGQETGLSPVVALGGNGNGVHLNLPGSPLRNEDIIVQALAQTGEDILIQLTDETGRILIRRNYTMTPGSNTITLNTRYLPAGSYWIYGSGRNGITNVVRLIKQ